MRDNQSQRNQSESTAPAMQGKKGGFKKKNKLNINKYNQLVRASSSKHNTRSIKNQIRDLKRFVQNMDGKVASEVIEEKKKQLKELVGKKKISRAKTFITLKYKEIRANGTGHYQKICFERFMGIELKKINRRIRKLEKENGDPEEIEKFKRLGIYCHVF